MELAMLTGLNKMPLGLSMSLNLCAASLLPICSVKQDPAKNNRSLCFSFVSKPLGINSKRKFMRCYIKISVAIVLLICNASLLILFKMCNDSK